MTNNKMGFAPHITSNVTRIYTVPKTDNNNTNNNSNQTNNSIWTPWTIAGAAVGGVAVLGGVGYLVWYFFISKSMATYKALSSIDNMQIHFIKI